MKGRHQDSIDPVGPDLMAEGLSNPQIAQRLGVSEFTVKRHVANILTKLDLPTRAAAYAAR